MSKEELISFIESIDFEYCSNMVLTYCKKKPSESSYIPECDKIDMQQKTITFQKDLEYLINENSNWNRERCERLYQQMDILEKEIVKLKEGVK